jgi:hypothetical protein
MENTLQTVLTISNSDIVTMLIVKQKKELKSRLPELNEEKINLLSKYARRLAENLQQRWNENSSKGSILASARTLLEIYNPGIKFTLDLDNSLTEAATRRVHNTFGNRMNRAGYFLQVKETKFSVGPLPRLSAVCVDEKDEPMFNPYMFSDFSVKEDQKLCEEYITLSIEDSNKLIEIDTEMCDIDAFLRDDKKLHDHIVAQMTERAIENNQEMKILLSGIKLLS